MSDRSGGWKRAGTAAGSVGLRVGRVAGVAVGERVAAAAVGGGDGGGRAAHGDLA